MMEDHHGEMMMMMRDYNIKNVILYWMDGEISNYIKVWLSVYISLLYCFLAARFVSNGVPRFFAFLPIMCLFTALPLYLHTLHLGITFAFFIAWLANFKLLMFAFNLGPLSDPSASSSLPRFLAIASLPIRIQAKKMAPFNQKSVQSGNFGEIPSQESMNNGQKAVQSGNFGEIPYEKSAKQSGKSSVQENGGIPFGKSTKKSGKNSSVMNYAVKGILLASMIKLYDYNDHINPFIIWILYCFHIYLALEIILAIVATLARVSLGAELEPTFNEPLLSTSLQDFWGRRWNIMVTRVLRPSVYEPVHKVSTKILGRELAPLPAVFSTFVVSAIMHELIFYYMGRSRPTWKVTGFFLLHGASLVVEIVVKKVVGDSWRMPRFAATGLVFLFVLVTGIWLFLPEMLRNNADVRAFEEYAALGAFFRDVGRALALMPSPNSTRISY